MITLFAPFSMARDWCDSAHLALLKRQRPIEDVTVDLSAGEEIIKYFPYDHSDCRDSAGYVSLVMRGSQLIVRALCENDYTILLRDDVIFINGKRLRFPASGRAVELAISSDAEILVADTMVDHLGARFEFVRCLYRVVRLGQRAGSSSDTASSS